MPCGGNPRSCQRPAASSCTALLRDRLARAAQLLREVLQLGKAVLHGKHGRRIVDVHAGFEWKVRDLRREDVDETPLRVTRHQIATAGLAPLPVGLLVLVVLADLVLALGHLDRLGLPEREGVDRAGRPAPAILAVAVAGTLGIARDFDLHGSAEALSGVRLFFAHESSLFDALRVAHDPTCDEECAYADSATAWSSPSSFAASVTSVGFRPFSIVSLVTTHFLTSRREGSSNWTSSRVSSRIERRPRAPVSRRIALSAIECSESSAKTSSIPSKEKNFWNCLTSALRGSVRIVTRSSRCSWWMTEITGSRPMNSGISPYSTRSSGRTSSKASPVSLSFEDVTSAPNPTPLWPIRRSTTLSRFAKAPPQMKRMFVVSIVRNSWCGCLRPPCGGTDATVPSRILSSACWTPSPDTSRVIEGFSSFRQILSTSSM